MASLVAKIVGKKILGETIKNKFGTEDPYFEQVPATRLNGTPNGKFKKRRKAIPPGISDHDAKVLTKVKRRAYRLDMSLFSCCGLRFGWGSVIGLVPAIGDVIDALLALMVMRSCNKVEDGLPASVRIKMYMNVMLDFAVGLVPFVGDVADAAFKANTRNAALLEAHLREKGRETLRKNGMPIPDIDPSDPREYDRFQKSSPETTSRQPSPHPAMTAATQSRRDPAPPPAARVKESGSGGGFLGFGRSRRDDIEMGTGGQESGHT